MTFYNDRNGALARCECTTLRIEVDPEHANMPETAAAELNRFLRHHGLETHTDAAGATVISLSPTAEKLPWLAAIVTGRLVSALWTGACGPVAGLPRSIWIACDEERAGVAICVHPGGDDDIGNRSPYRRTTTKD